MSGETDVDSLPETTTEVQKDSSYPLKITYCGVCTYPRDFCDYTSKFAQCKEWWKANHEDLYFWDNDEDDDDSKSSLAKKSQAKQSKKQPTTNTGVHINTISRTKKKFVTVIKGLDQFDIKLNDAAKLFSKKFATSAAIKSDKGANDKGILMQGDVSDEVSEYILEKWGDKIKEEDLHFLVDGKKA